MPVMGPSENPEQVEEAYQACLDKLEKEFYLAIKPNYPFLLGGKEKSEKRWDERLTEFKESIRRLFELDSWESF